MSFHDQLNGELRKYCADRNYWKAKAEGEHLAFVAVQEENDKLKNSMDNFIEQHESLSDENEKLKSNFREFINTADYNEHQSQDRERDLRVALEFYANKDNHEQYYIGNGEPAILEDAGKIARIALGQEVVE